MSGPALVVLVGVGGACACGGTSSRAAGPAPAPATDADRGLAGPHQGACDERYDAASADLATDARVASVTALRAAAQTGDRRTLARAVELGLAVAPPPAWAPSAATLARAAELEAVLLALPAACAPVWYAQPGRFAVQPQLEGEPADPARAALADAIDAADHVVATCDGGCAVAALALAPTTGAVVAWMRIAPGPP